MTDAAEPGSPQPPQPSEAAPKDSSMEIHKPKPVHNWREFFKEIGVVVLGVCIALGAEQTVEALHWRHKVRDAAEAMRLEMRDDNGPQAYTRVAVQACFDRQLDAIQTAIEAGRDRPAITALIGGYRPPFRSWDSEAWNAVLASDVGSHVTAEQMIDWSKPYRTIPSLQTANAQEHADWIGLQPTHRSAERLSPGEADTMLAAVQRLRQDNRDTAERSRLLLYGLDKFGINQAPERQRRILDGLRSRFRDCVVVPSTAGVDPNDQLKAMRPVLIQGTESQR
jgi:hypothetical protein